MPYPLTSCNMKYVDIAKCNILSSVTVTDWGSPTVSFQYREFRRIGRWSEGQEPRPRETAVPQRDAEIG